VEVFLERAAASIAEARRVVTDRLTGHFPTELIERAQVLVTEMVTNVLVHGQGAPMLCVEYGPRRVRIDVADDGPHIDVLEARDGGLGVRLLEAWADRWGVESVRGDGKKVWFELDATSDGGGA
jgi:anti-sigma regulatory factor (Ser/Thr protein kinase)